MCRVELIARSRDFERLSVQKGNNYKGKLSNEIKEYEFDQYGRYIPSKQFIRNKKDYVMKDEKLRNRDKEFYTAKHKMKTSINNLMKCIEKEIFKDKV